MMFLDRFQVYLMKYEIQIKNLHKLSGYYIDIFVATEVKYLSPFVKRPIVSKDWNLLFSVAPALHVL